MVEQLFAYLPLPEGIIIGVLKDFISLILDGEVGIAGKQSGDVEDLSGLSEEIVGVLSPANLDLAAPGDIFCMALDRVGIVSSKGVGVFRHRTLTVTTAMVLECEIDGSGDIKVLTQLLVRGGLFIDLGGEDVGSLDDSKELFSLIGDSTFHYRKDRIGYCSDTRVRFRHGDQGSGVVGQVKVSGLENLL